MISAKSGTVGFGSAWGNGMSVIGTAIGSDADRPAVLADWLEALTLAD